MKDGYVGPVFCYGNPGVGKAYVRQEGLFSGERCRRGHWQSVNNSSLVIDSLYDETGEGDIAVVGLYCYFLV